jgi:hypothetical protein
MIVMSGGLVLLETGISDSNPAWVMNWRFRPVYVEILTQTKAFRGFPMSLRLNYGILPENVACPLFSTSFQIKHLSLCSLRYMERL